MGVKDFFSEEEVLKIRDCYHREFWKPPLLEFMKERKELITPFKILWRLVDDVVLSFTISFNADDDSAGVFNSAVWPSVERFFITQLRRRGMLSYYYEHFETLFVFYPFTFTMLGVDTFYDTYFLYNFINNELWNEYLKVPLEARIELDGKYLTNILHFVATNSSKISRLWAKYITLVGAIARCNFVFFNFFKPYFPEPFSLFLSPEIGRYCLVFDSHDEPDESKLRITWFNKTPFEGSLEKIDDNRYKFSFFHYSYSATYEIPIGQFRDLVVSALSSISGKLKELFESCEICMSEEDFLCYCLDAVPLSETDLSKMSDDNFDLLHYAGVTNVVDLSDLMRDLIEEFGEYDELSILKLLKSINPKLARELESFLDKNEETYVDADVFLFVVVGGDKHLKKILPILIFKFEIGTSLSFYGDNEGYGDLGMACVLLPGGSGFWLPFEVTNNFYDDCFSLFNVLRIPMRYFLPMWRNILWSYLNLPLLLELYGIEVDWSPYVVEDSPDVEEFYFQKTIEIPDWLQIDGDLDLFDTADYISVFFYEDESEDNARLIITDTTNDVWFDRYRSPVHAVLAKTGNLSALINIVQDFTLWPGYPDIYALFDKYQRLRGAGDIIKK